MPQAMGEIYAKEEMRACLVYFKNFKSCMMLKMNIMYVD